VLLVQIGWGAHQHPQTKYGACLSNDYSKLKVTVMEIASQEDINVACQ
jgi:hypothetical protein